jgi:hypothetical protein
MVAAWVLHLFPDMTLVAHTTGWDALGFLRYWEENVVKHLLVVGDWRRMGGLNCQNREDLLGAAGIPSGKMFDVLRLCPDWPALTSGGPRHLHNTGAFFHKAYLTLRAHDPETWVMMSEEEMDKHFLLNHPLATSASVSTAPEPTPGLAALPDLRHEFFQTSFLDWTRPNLRKAAAEMDVCPRDVIVEYAKLNPDRAVRMLSTWEKFPVELFKLVSVQRSRCVVTSV